ncbi:cytochrome P450 [Aureobasidium pullulans EXF-150]|uniref:Cytochrome P450 n=2 Tax=Aureobasidium pullulans TaxID=5580 RepID=A0A074Y5L3_AURPU|nr:cytochrome P450 [Aureobasidium pullulans EXF-150]KEQ82176.1 cytochrome P450 [Aureobasidium pullulans EXF-150]THW94620.1 cytochrome P450 [Aureobasidium pullulans]
MELKHLIIGLAIAFLSYIFVESRRPKAGVQEPPALRTRIPFIGHIIGIAIHGLRYFGKACEGSDEPIVTIDFLVSKVYLVNKSSAVAQVQRNAKVITFDPFLDSAAERMVNVSKRGLKLLTGKENGGGDLNRKIVKAMHPALLGPGLDVANRNMVNNLSKSVDELASFSGKSFDLYAWAKHAITIASTDAVWGPKNPIKDPENEAAFWDFDSHLRLLVFNIFPSIIARKAYLGREKVVSAFVRYYNEGGQHEASELAQARWRVQHEGGAATEDIARMETATVLGVVSNTTPSSFWMLYDVYSRPALLSQLRDEVREHALKKNESGEMTIDLAAMRDNCPNLLATFQEVLRTHSNSAPTRFVTDDVVLNEKFLLKKGRVLLMPGMNMNYEPSIWGDDSQKFDPTRFKKETLKQRPTSFMSFGASPSLCPGRHFASGEILGMAAMMILRYDITPASGKWTMPKFWKGAIAASMPFPAEPFNVTITPRVEFANTTWSYTSTDGKGKFPLITG